ncbi:MAG: hypothetical protein WBG46_10835 [Nonlabens sp.]
MVADKAIQITVDRSFYTGRDYLVQGKMGGTTVFLRSERRYENKTEVAINLNA